LISHRMPLSETVEGYDIFKNAATTNALKVVLTA